MGDNPVTLDFTKAVPIATPSQTSPGVSLDFNQAQHLDQSSQQSQQQNTETQPFTDEHLAHIRALNDARPWWRKMLGLGPSEDQMTPEDKAQEQKFWDEQKARMTEALRDNYKARADVPVGAVKAAGRSGVGIANLGIKAYDKVTGADKPTLTSLITGKRGHEIEMPKALESDGSEGQELGGMFENVLEFLAGDAALKALTMSQKLSLGLRIAKVAESSPACGTVASFRTERITDWRCKRSARSRPRRFHRRCVDIRWNRRVDFRGQRRTWWSGQVGKTRH